MVDEVDYMNKILKTISPFISPGFLNFKLMPYEVE